MGPPAAGKSSLKHLLVHNESKVINTSTPVLETPAIVSLSSEQFAAQEASSSWKVVSDESMAACIRIACRTCEYQYEEPFIPEATPQHDPLKPTSTLAQKVRSLFKGRKEKKGTTESRSNPVEQQLSLPGQVELGNETSQAVSALEQAHKALLDNLGTGVEDQLFQTARFVHLLDSGGQPCSRQLESSIVHLHNTQSAILYS